MLENLAFSFSIGFAEYLAEGQHTVSTSDDTRLLVSNKLKQLGSAMWRCLPSPPRFSLHDGKAAGSDDREAFLFSQAERLWVWCNAALLHQHTPYAIRVNSDAVERGKRKALKQLCEYLVRIDGEVWRGTIDGIQELVDKTRNYDKIMLFAMTHDERQTQLYQNGARR